MGAGIVLVTKFAQGADAFARYIDYIDDEKKTQNADGLAYSLDFDDYVDGYMSNPVKATGLFTKDKDRLQDASKKDLKEVFSEAQKRGSLIWQTVISFDLDFLKEYGLYDGKGGVLDDAALMGYTREAMHVLLSKEGMPDAVWSAAIHKNLYVHNNVHIHIATVDLHPSWKEGVGRCRLGKDGVLYQRGVMHESSLRAAKSRFFSCMDKDTGATQRIGQLRDEIYEKRRAYKASSEEGSLAARFAQLAARLPRDMRLWRYNMDALAVHRKDIDAMTSDFLMLHCKDEYEEYEEALLRQAKRYKDAYGQDAPNSYVQNKVADLYARLGNILLREMTQWEAENRSKGKVLKHGGASPRPPILTAAERIASAGKKASRTSACIGRLKTLFRKDLQSMKNLAAYERLRMDEERGC